MCADVRITTTHSESLTTKEWLVLTLIRPCFGGLDMTGT